VFWQSVVASVNRCRLQADGNGNPTKYQGVLASYDARDRMTGWGRMRAGCCCDVFPENAPAQRWRIGSKSAPKKPALGTGAKQSPAYFNVLSGLFVSRPRSPWKRQFPNLLPEFEHRPTSPANWTLVSDPGSRRPI